MTRRFKTRIRKSDGPRVDRLCLGCRKMFASLGIGNRICPQCSYLSASPFAPDGIGSVAARPAYRKHGGAA